MKFSCTQENLKKGLLITGAIAGKNMNLPILNNVLIRIEGNAIHLLSTNLEVAVTCIVRGKVDQAGEFTIPSKLLLEYVSLLPEDRVDLELVDGSFKISCRKNSTDIKGIPASEFPLIPKVERKSSLSVSGRGLRQALAQVTFAVSGVESRPELTGVHFNVNPAFATGKLVMAATDSYRLSEKIIPLKEGKGTNMDGRFSVIVPGKTLNELMRILSVFKDSGLEDDTVEMVFGENQIMFRFDDVELISRVIDGRYPDYRPIVPERFSTEAAVDKSALMQAVKSAALFSRSGLQDVHFAFDPDEGLKVMSSESQIGKNESLVEAKVTGKKNSITVNYRYFLDGLSAMDGSDVRFKMIDATNPCALTPGAAEEGGFLYIVMPIKQ